MITIRFMYCGEAGCWHSAEGRFDISPGGWRGGVTPDFYELRDAMHRSGERITRYDTVRECKQAATVIAIKDAVANGAVR